MSQPIKVSNPEISQAFYGNLSGTADIYQIFSNTWFHLYVQLVVPAISGAQKNFRLDVDNWKNIIASLNGELTSWQYFYEPFAGDRYFQWPTFEKDVDPWIYTIRISNLWFIGKYSLAIGKIESFPWHEIVSTYRDLPSLKIDFFEKPWRSLFCNIVVGGVLSFCIIIFFLMFFIFRFFRKK